MCSGARPGGGGGGFVDGETRVTWQVQADILKNQRPSIFHSMFAANVPLAKPALSGIFN